MTSTQGGKQPLKFHGNLHFFQPWLSTATVLVLYHISKTFYYDTVHSHTFDPLHSPSLPLSSDAVDTLNSLKSVALINSLASSNLPSFSSCLIFLIILASLIIGERVYQDVRQPTAAIAVYISGRLVNIVVADSCKYIKNYDLH